MVWTQTNYGDRNVTDTTNQSASAFANPLTPGSIIFVCYAAQDYAGSFPVPTDTAGNTYIDGGYGKALLRNANEAQITVWYALNTSSTASNVVTTHVDSGKQIYNTWAVEFTGNAASSPIDAFSGQQSQFGGAAGPNSYTLTSVTPSVNGALILGFGASYGAGGFTSAGTSPNAFTSIYVGNVEYFVQTTAAAISPTAGATTSSLRFATITLAVKPFVAVDDPYVNENSGLQPFAAPDGMITY